MRKLRLKNFELENREIQNFEPNCVYISNVIFDEGFEILVKVGDFVKKSEPIMQKNGQFVLSPIFGKIEKIYLEENAKKELVYFVKIKKINLTKNAQNCAKNDEKNAKIHANLSENMPKIVQKNANIDSNFGTKIANFDAKNNEKNINFDAKFDAKNVNFDAKNDGILDEKYVFEKPKMNTKQDLILACKNFGIVSKHCFAYKIFEKTNEKLVIDAFDGDYEFNNQILLENCGEKIKKSIEFLLKILDVKKVEIFCNKKHKNDINLLLESVCDDVKKVIKTKQTKFGFTFEDLINIFNLNFAFGQTTKIVSIVGKAIKKNMVLSLSFGTKIADILDFCGGLKENLDEIEDFKYMALVAFNDEQMLMQKIKSAKDLNDKQKLENMLHEKQQQANENIFSKIELYHQKYLNCLSAVFLKTEKAKIPTKNFDIPLNFDNFGLQFLSFEEFY